MTTQPLNPAGRRTHDVPLRIVWPLLVVVIAFALAGFVYGILDAAGISADSSQVVAELVSGAAILGFGLWRFAALPGFERRLIWMPKTRLKWCVLIGIGLAIALRIVVGIVVTIGDSVDPSLCRRLVELDRDAPDRLWHKLAITFALVVLAPLGEELVFRGLLLRGLARRMNFPLAAIVSGVLFASAHLQYWLVWPLVIGISIFGVVAAFAYRQWGFPTNAVMHATFNAVAAIALFVDFGPGSDTTSCR